MPSAIKLPATALDALNPQSFRHRRATTKAVRALSATGFIVELWRFNSYRATGETIKYRVYFPYIFTQYNQCFYAVLSPGVAVTFLV